jgi:Flp pilus assembly protein TadD
VNFVLVLKLEEDFQVKRSRLLLSVDPDIKTGVDALLRGRVYAREGMWGLAAIHFRRAAALNPSSPDEHIAVAQACVHLKESELARYALERARELQPGDGRVDAVLELLERQTSGVAGPNSTAPSGTVPKAPTTPES